MPLGDHLKNSKKKILLAEDDDSMRRFVEVILKKAHYDVITAEDGLEAMKAAIENEIDAVIADAVMPGMTGYDLCRMMRGNDGKKHIPFIILSGLNQDKAVNKDGCQADAYLMKEENMATVITKTLASLLDGKAKN